MDPLSALGVAASVVQFVDFASKLVIETYGVYKSADSASPAVINLQELTDDLERLTSELASAPQQDSKQSRDEEALQRLAYKCYEMAQELQEYLHGLRVESKGLARSWEAFHKTLKRVASKGKLERFRRELYEVKCQLSLHMLNTVKNTQSSLMKTMGALTNQSAKLHIENGIRLDQLEQNLMLAFQKQLQECDCHERFREQISKQEDRVMALEAKTKSKQSERGPLKQRLAATLELGKETERLQSLRAKESPIMGIFEEALTVSAQRLETLRAGGKFVETVQRILGSLRYKEMPYRHREINEAYDKTFAWVFEGEKTMFPEWLANGSGTFWIRGKPGSGKSTLMKLLCQSQQTEALLRKWSDSRPVVVIRFYFWNAGLPMQKSQQGLLQSLLLQILRKCPDLVPVCFPRRWKADREFLEMPEPWGRRELLDALNVVLLHDNLPVKFCLFIDGLDEYERSIVEGDHDDLIKTLAGFEHSSSFKVCVSSRPWDQFSNAYAAKTGFVLQNYTRADVEVFVRGRLSEKSQYLELAKRDSRAEAFVAQILDKAQGVFLWVWLIVGDLLYGLSMQDDIADLQKRLNELPNDLADYFRLMLNRTDRLYRERAACLLLVLVRASPLTPLAFRYINHEVERPGSPLPQASTPSDSLASLLPEVKRYINQWCRDMVECSDTGEADNDYKLDFVHRTVKDFLDTKEMQQLLQTQIQIDFEPRRTLMHIYLFHATSANPNQPKAADDEARMASWCDIVGEVMFFAKDFEDHHQVSPDSVMSALCKIGEQRFPESPRYKHWTQFYDEDGSFMSYPVAFGLVQYVRKHVADRGTDLLDDVLIDKMQHSRLAPNRIPDMEMLDVLLQAGADLNFASPRLTHNRTAWHRFLRRCKFDPEPKLLPIAHHLIELGAAVDIEVLTGTRTVKKEIPLTPKVKIDRTVEVDVFSSVAECLQECCSSADFEQLVALLDEKKAKSAATVTVKNTGLSRLKLFWRTPS